MQSYYTQMLTVDQHIKEIRLFNLGDLFLGRFKENAENLFEYGTISESGSHNELIALGGRYAELFNLQASAYN